MEATLKFSLPDVAQKMLRQVVVCLLVRGSNGFLHGTTKNTTNGKEIGRDRLHEGTVNKLMMRELRRINQRIFATEVFYFEMTGFQSLVRKLG